MRCRPRPTATRTATSTTSAREMLPALAAQRLADAVDAFCEGIAFSPAQTARVFDAAQRLGLPVKLHADQLSNLGGAALAAALRRALGRPSRIHRRGRRRRDGRGRHGRGAAARRLLLPARDADCRRSSCFRTHGVPIAVATDCNPGTSPLTSLLLADEHGGDAVPPDRRGDASPASRATPRARSAGSREIGTLEAGKSLRSRHLGHRAPGRAVYRIGFNPLHARVWRGQ